MADLVGERYEPLAVVARGDEGEVLRALDHLGGRPVALQVRHLVSAGELEALVSESLVLIDVMRHPSLPLVREHFLLDDSYYLVMDWITGVGLDRILTSDGRPRPALRTGHGLPHPGGRRPRAPPPPEDPRRPPEPGAGPPGPHRGGDSRSGRLRLLLPVGDVPGTARRTTHPGDRRPPPGRHRPHPPDRLTSWTGDGPSLRRPVRRRSRRRPPGPASGPRSRPRPPRPSSPSALIDDIRSGATTLMPPPTDVLLPSHPELHEGEPAEAEVTTGRGREGRWSPPTTDPVAVGRGGRPPPLPAGSGPAAVHALASG